MSGHRETVRPGFPARPPEEPPGTTTAPDTRPRRLRNASPRVLGQARRRRCHSFKRHGIQHRACPGPARRTSRRCGKAQTDDPHAVRSQVSAASIWLSASTLAQATANPPVPAMAGVAGDAESLRMAPEPRWTMCRPAMREVRNCDDAQAMVGDTKSVRKSSSSGTPCTAWYRSRSAPRPAPPPDRPPRRGSPRRRTRWPRRPAPMVTA